MALGINYEPGMGGGDYIAHIKYDSRAGRMFRVDRVDGQSNAEDITREFKAVMDFENIEIGFINFDTGSAPDFSVARLGEGPAGRPSDKHKPGVRLMTKLGKDCSGGNDLIRELASTAKAFLRGIDAAHDLYIEGVKANPGHLPVMMIDRTEAVTTEAQGKKTTNYVPYFKIVAWAPRPADLVYKPKAPATAQSQGSSSGGSQPPSTGSTRAAPPANEPAEEENFG